MALDAWVINTLPLKLVFSVRYGSDAMWSR